MKFNGDSASSFARASVDLGLRELLGVVIPYGLLVPDIFENLDLLAIFILGGPEF